MQGLVALADAIAGRAAAIRLVGILLLLDTPRGALEVIAITPAVPCNEVLRVVINKGNG